MKVIFRSTPHPLDEPRTDHHRIVVPGVQDVYFTQKYTYAEMVLVFNKASDMDAASALLDHPNKYFYDNIGPKYRLSMIATRWGTHIINGRHYGVVEITGRNRAT